MLEHIGTETELQLSLKSYQSVCTERFVAVDRNATQ